MHFQEKRLPSCDTYALGKRAVTRVLRPTSPKNRSPAGVMRPRCAWQSLIALPNLESCYAGTLDTFVLQMTVD